MARAPPGDYGGRHRRVRPPPRGTLSTTNYDQLTAAAQSSALRLHPWREGGIGVVPAILLWFIPVLVFFILIALFLEVGDRTPVWRAPR